MAELQSSDNPATKLPANWKPSTVAWAIGIGLLLLLLYWQVGIVFVARWFGKSTFYHCLAVPPLVGWLVWQRWERLKATEVHPSVGGIALLGIGLAVVLIGTRLGVNLFIGLSFPFVIAGLVLLLWGWVPLRILAMPILVSFFAIPPPEHALAVVTMPLQKLSAVITEIVARNALGVPVIRDGINLDLHGFQFVVAEQCSGMSSFLALSLTVIFLVELSGLTAGRKASALIALPFVVICANVIRLCLVLITAQYFGPHVAISETVHYATDAAVYLSALIAFIMFLSALLPREEIVEEVVEDSVDDPARVAMAD